MILDLDHFVATESPYWQELEALLEVMEKPGVPPTLEQARRLHYLYRRASSALAKLDTFADEPEMRSHLQGLVARAYADIHGARTQRMRLKPRQWINVTVPQTFRRHIGAFFAASAVMLAGSLFGAGVMVFDPAQKSVLIPPQFGHLEQTPSERVAKEELRIRDEMTVDAMTGFSAMLWTNNTRVSILTLAAGIFFGLGSYLLLFYNGILLGAVAADYVLDGQAVFLLGWLLPHGAVEIPSILIAGQAGLVLGAALAGWGDSKPLRARLRAAAPDIVTLIFTVAILLIWAGALEAFFSQFHEPLLPYWFKIAFGVVELLLLFSYLALGGRGAAAAKGAGTANVQARTAHA